MSIKRQCSNCEADLTGTDPVVRCPKCLLELGLNENQVEGDALEASAGSVERIGRYKLLQQIGEGGCGVVYMAEQEEPVRRRVALKVIKLGMDTKSVVARFEAERQALAMMDHPNIARVFDGGTTEQGRPYFVMELVRGIKVTEYCDQHELPMRERLELFMQVCQAVQHAHQKGIIHRDLKPSNILVTVNDGRAVPKVIDFGIAKAIEQRLTDKTIFTAFNAFVGTPAYVSPEQAEMSSLDIDTRSDIYSLGVLLYELLTGKTPFEHSELAQSGIDAMRRIIREKEPPRPSTRLGTLSSEELTTTAKHRRVEGPRLITNLRGDLDWIVMKCLEKDRTRRYDTANTLAADIQRYLNNEVITARAPSAGYRLRKLVRRHKLQFAGATLIVGVLIVASFVSIWQAVQTTRAERKATAQARTAQAVKDFLVEQVLAVNPFVEPSPDPNRLVLAQRIARNLEGKFPGEPLIEAEMRWAIGHALLNLGDFTGGEAECRKTHEIRRRILGPNHSDTLWPACFVGQICASTGRTNEAATLLGGLLPRTRRPLDQLTSGEAEVLWAYGDLLNDMGNAIEALRYYEPAMQASKRTMDQRDYRYKNKLTRFARTYERVGNVKQAEALLKEALHESQKQFPGDHPLVLQFEKALAGFFYRRGRLNEAVPLFERVIPAYHRALGTNHNVTFDSEIALAQLYEDLGRTRDALTIYASLHPRWTDLCRFPVMRNNCITGAQLFVRERRFEDARTMLVPIRQSFQEKPAEPQHFENFLIFESLWAEVLDSEEKHEEAAVMRNAVIAEASKLWSDPNSSRRLVTLAHSFGERGCYKEARQVLASYLRTNLVEVPKSRDEFEVLVEATAATEGWSTAARLCQKHFELFTNSISAWRFKATVLFHTGDRKSYAEAVARILALNPKGTNAQDWRSVLNTVALDSAPLSAEVVAKCEVLINALENQLKTSSGVEKARIQRALGAACLRLGRASEAVNHLEMALSDIERSEQLRTLILKALALRYLERIDEARVTLAEADALANIQLPPLPEYEGFVNRYQLGDVILLREAEAALTRAGASR